MTDHDPDRDPLGGLTPPRPPERLRATTLLAARRAATLETAPPAWHTLPGLFAAQPGWTAALVLVTLAHVAFGFFADRRRAGPAGTPRSLEVAAQPDLLRLPRVGRPALDPLESMPIDDGTDNPRDVGGHV